MYSLIMVDHEEIKKVKRISKNIVESRRHKKYVGVLFDKELMRHSMKRIQSKLHRIRIYDVCKISLSCFDNKRYDLEDCVSTLIYFHRDILHQ